MGLSTDALNKKREEKKRIFNTEEEIIAFKKEQKEKGFILEDGPHLLEKDSRHCDEDVMQRCYKEKDSEDRFDVVSDLALEEIWKREV